MNALHLTPKPEACLSDLTLDRLHGGELTEFAKRDALTHLRTCADCQSRRVAIEAVPPQLPSEVLLREVAPRRDRGRRTPILAAFSVLAAAAAVVLIARPRLGGDTGGPSPVTRLKGSDFVFDVLARRAGGSAEPVLPDVPLHPGDVIGFRARTRSGGYLTIVSIDGAGRVSSYLPGPAGELTELLPGERLIDGGVALDDVLGRETLIAVLCVDRAVAARVLDATREAVGHGGSEVGQLAIPCEQARAALVKEAAR